MGDKTERLLQPSGGMNQCELTNNEIIELFLENS